MSTTTEEQLAANALAFVGRELELGLRLAELDGWIVREPD
jgi:hypothetical protein